MNKKVYNEISKKIIPKEDKLKNIIISFFVGGTLGLIGQVIVSILIKNGVKYNDATSIMIVLFIFVSCILTGFGFFDTLVMKAKSGLIIPITGFAHSITSAMLEYKNEGYVTGIGANAFKLAGSVILYGVVSAYFFGIIRYLFFGG